MVSDGSTGKGAGINSTPFPFAMNINFWPTFHRCFSQIALGMVIRNLVESVEVLDMQVPFLNVERMRHSVNVYGRKQWEEGNPRSW